MLSAPLLPCRLDIRRISASLWFVRPKIVEARVRFIEGTRMKSGLGVTFWLKSVLEGAEPRQVILNGCKQYESILTEKSASATNVHKTCGIPRLEGTPWHNASAFTASCFTRPSFARQLAVKEEHESYFQGTAFAADNSSAAMRAYNFTSIASHRSGHKLCSQEE